MLCLTYSSAKIDEPAKCVNTMRALTTLRRNRIMAAANLTPARLRELVEYDSDTGVFTWRTAGQGKRLGAPAGSITTRGYARVKVDYVGYPAHRLAWLYVHGQWPAHEIDHINGIKTDNRISNLRDVSATINRQNLRAAKSNSSSGLLGVFQANNKWVASIGVKRKRLTIGHFESKEDAYEAYLTAKRALHEGNTL